MAQLETDTGPRGEPAGAAVPFACTRAASTVAEASRAMVDELAEVHDLPSIYLLVDGRLRCQAARGYFQVVDGFSTDVGVIGRVVRTDLPVLVEDVTADPTFIAAIPGLRAEAAAPVRVGGVAVGAVSLETRECPPQSLLADAIRAADVLGEVIEALGGLPPVPLEQRLARIAVSLTARTDRTEIARRAVEGVIEISGMSSASLSRRSGAGVWSSRAAAGPLGDALRDWTDEEHAVMARWVGAGTSSHFPGGEAVPADYGFLQRSGVGAIAVQPLVVGGQVVGLLTTADTRPIPHDAARVAAVELLAGQVAATFEIAWAIGELTARATQDSLTGLRNSAQFARDLSEFLVEAPAEGVRLQDCLVVLDIDHFKQVNDSEGHPAGDRVLVELSAALHSQLRESDRLYRIGGDEFAVVLRGVGREVAEHVMARLLDAARGLGRTLSVGAVMLEGQESPHAREVADRCLYEAKRAGRDRYRLAP